MPPAPSGRTLPMSAKTEREGPCATRTCSRCRLSSRRASARRPGRASPRYLSLHNRFITLQEGGQHERETDAGVSTLQLFTRGEGGVSLWRRRAAWQVPLCRLRCGIRSGGPRCSGIHGPAAEPCQARQETLSAAQTGVRRSRAGSARYIHSRRMGALCERFDVVASPLDLFDRALALQRDLAHHHGMRHRTAIPHLVTAEIALHHDPGVVHVDRDRGRIAEVRPLRVRRLQ